MMACQNRPDHILGQTSTTGWISRLAATALLVGMALQGCDSSVEKAETQEIKAEDLVAIEIIVTDERRDAIRRLDPRFIESGRDNGVVCGKRGFFSKKGVMVIPPKFDYCRYLFGEQNFTSNGLAAVNNKGKYGYINTTGEMVIPARFQWASDFASNGLAVVRVDNGKWGYINTRGDMVIPAKFNHAGFFGYRDLALIQDEKGRGFININGEVVSRPNGSMSRLMSPGTHFATNGLAVGYFGPKDYRYINTNGDLAIPSMFMIAEPFSDNGLAAVLKLGDIIGEKEVLRASNEWGYINAKGEMVIPDMFRFANSFASNGLAAVAIGEGDGKWGYIDAKGKMVIPAKYDYAGSFATNGLAAFRENGKWGYINTKGDMVIEAKFEGAEDFYNNGIARVTENGKLSYINETGQIIVYIDEIAGRKVVKNAKDEVIWSEE